jgi:hypothetical protein
VIIIKIEGFFSGIKRANEVVSKLKSEGFTNSYVDLNDHYQINTDVRTKEFAFLSTSSNSDLVLNSGTPSGSTGKSPLLAASPMVSGMGNFEEIADINYKVIVEASEKDTNEVLQLIKSLGGTTSSPNVNLSQRIEDVDFGKGDPDFFKEL